MKISLKRFLLFLFNPIEYVCKSKFFVLFFLKPLNTFLPKLSPGNVYKDVKIWQAEKHYVPEMYNTFDSTSKEFLNYLFDSIKPSDSILDLCCNQGRFLISLEKAGYSKLYGVDIMKTSIEKLAIYQGLGGTRIKCKHSLVQDYLREMPSNSIDYAITYSASIELIHPSFDLFKELNRVTKKGFIFAIHEYGHSYPRFYRYLATKNMFHPVTIKKLSEAPLSLLHYSC